MSHPAFTLIETLIVCVLVGIAAAIATPRIHTTMDSLAVEGASRDVVNAFALARLAALRHRGADLQIDTISVTITAGGQTVLRRDIAHGYSVRLRTNVARVRYAATGMGLGVSNGTITISRGSAADTIVVSRLGRVRR